MNGEVEGSSTSSPEMRFADLPVQVRVLWAKSGDPQGHGLLAHILDVAAVAETLVRRESAQTLRWVADAFGLPQDAAPRWLAALVGLHDFGKAIPGFQCKWPTGQAADERAGLSFNAAALSVSRHDLASAALLRQLLTAKFPGAGWVLPIIQALAAHHGYVPLLREIREAVPRNEDAAWKEARTRLFEAYWRTLAPDGELIAQDIHLAAVAWLAGLVSVSDWIGSNRAWFPPGERDTTLKGHFEHALALAEAALDEIGWPRFAALLREPADTDTLVRRALAEPVAHARPLQRAADRLLADPRGPVLMIVEAPMGEGKTELAFLAYLRLQAANGHRGMYVALPTQATGNAMFERALTFLSAFASNMRLDIQLVHSAASLNDRVPRLGDINASTDESIASSTWFSQRKRSLLSPYGAGTIDQALLATLNVKHHFVRLWGLANRVVVLDEIHAYDTYTEELIEALLRWLKAMNCSVILMSATLPNARREALLRSWGTSQVPDIPYPRILLVNDGQAVGEHVACRSLTPIAVSGIAEDLETIAQTALSALDRGGCGAVIVNTVQRAQDLYRLLKGAVGSNSELLLFHARYPADERSERELAVLERFGRRENGKRPTRALLVATQVVEQSLDVDFDFMLSDLAPIDLLLQRAGRLHRHERDRPSIHRQPRFIVAGLTADREPEMTQTRWEFVYAPYVLYRTWITARSENVWRLPEDIDRLVQAVYDHEIPDGESDKRFMQKLDVAFAKRVADVQRQKQLAINVAIDARAEPHSAYSNKRRASEEGDGDSPEVVTRLGNDSVAAVPIRVDADGWRLFPGDEPFDPHAEINDALAHRIFRRQVRLSHGEVVRGLLARPLPKGFEMHPLLRNLKPLLLTDGVAVFDQLRVRLDSELGVVYEPAEVA